MEPFNGEADVDLYTDEHVNGGQREVVVNDNESPCSLTWMTQSNASPPAVKTHSNGMTPLSSSSTSLPTREHLCISTLNYQLTERSSKESDSSRISTARRRQGRHPCEESRFDKADLQSQAGSLQLEAMGLSKSETEVSCSCLQSPHHYQSHCIECETWHSNTCALLEHCCSVEHSVVTSFSTAEEMKESGAVSTQSEILRVSDLRTSPSLTTSSAVMSSLSLCDKSIIHPISYHDCCNLSQLDPEVLCYSCSVFHSLKCRNVDYCKVHHTIKQLRECVCGKPCSRKPLVLCRYCGNEYCTDCWYRNPVICKCGQTFDQSSSVWFVFEEYCTNEAQLAKSQCLNSAHFNQVQSNPNVALTQCWNAVLHVLQLFCLGPLSETLITLLSNYSLSGHMYHNPHLKSIVYCDTQLVQFVLLGQFSVTWCETQRSFFSPVSVTCTQTAVKRSIWHISVLNVCFIIHEQMTWRQ